MELNSRIIKTGFVLIASLTAMSCSKRDFGVGSESQEYSAGVTYNNKVDVVLMVDNSSSMLQYQTKFASEIPAMISALNAKGLDYHIAVVTSDMRTGGNGGRFIGSPKYLSASSPNLVADLQSRVTIGQNGSDVEQGLKSLKTVLQPSYLGSEGVGFFRDDALLAMITLTNEDDYSSDSLSSLKQFFDTLKPPFKGGDKSWLLNFIGVVSIDGACRTTAEFKEAGLRYMDLADYSGGIKQSVCDSTLTQAVTNLQRRIVEILSSYHLDRKPRVETIEVIKNGNLVAQDPVNGWSYDPATNNIYFHGTSQPGALDLVRVNYTPAEGT